MRTALLLCCLLFAGCNQTPAPDPVVPPGGHGALHPPQGSLGYTEAEVEAIRAKLKTIQYPQRVGYTIRELDLESARYTSLGIDDYKPNSANLLTTHNKRYILSSKAELLIVEDHYAAKDDAEVRKMERSATIRPITR